MGIAYVYVYRDESGAPVYVGKGKGGRAHWHVGVAKALNDGKEQKASRFVRWLARCLREGRGYSVEIVERNLTDEAAYELEAKLIAQWRRRHEGGTLRNVAEGGAGLSREGALITNGRPERRAQSRELANKMWAVPENRTRAAKRAGELWSDPEWSSTRRAELTERNRSEEQRKASQRSGQALWSRPDASERKAQLAERMRKINEAKKAKA